MNSVEWVKIRDENAGEYYYEGRVNGKVHASISKHESLRKWELVYNVRMDPDWPKTIVVKSVKKGQSLLEWIYSNYRSTDKVESAHLTDILID